MRYSGLPRTGNANTFVEKCSLPKGSLGPARNRFLSGICVVMCTGTRGTLMIRSFRYRGLKRLYERGDVSRGAVEQLPRIEDPA